MQIQSLHTAHKIGWTPAYDWWTDHQLDHASGFNACALWVETAPVMPATVLGLELLLQDRSLHLQLASDLILKDVGATLHILRLVAREFPNPDERPSRMVDCLAALETSAWFSVLAGNSMPSCKTSPEISSMWNHCRIVAQYAKLIAESLGEVMGEEAYLAGLLHEVENMAAVIGKRKTAALGEGLKLSQVLTPSLVTALQSAKQRGTNSIWRYVLASAHALATASSMPDVARFWTAPKLTVAQ